jgi:hypothetical protein
MKRGLTPKVAIIGPKGSGKSIYRQFLASAQHASIPHYLCNVLRVRNPSWGHGVAWVRDPKKNRGVAEPAEWEWDEDLVVTTAIGTQRRSFLRKLGGTNKLTIHPLRFPSLHASADAEADLLDFPGEHLQPLSDPAQLEGLGLTRDEYQRFVDHDVALIRQCRVVLLTLPYWLVLPHEWRGEDTPLDRAMAARRAGEGASAARVAEELAVIRRGRQVREDDLFRSAADWLGLLQSIVDSPAKPTLVVVFTMLDSTWEDELRPPDGGLRGLEEARERLRRVRTLITSRAANGEANRFRAKASVSLVQPFARAWHDLQRASEMKELLEELHDTLDHYVQDARSNWSRGALGHQALGRLGDALDSAGAHRVRYMAMNVVSEHSRLAQPGVKLDDFPLELRQAGALLPMVYLCGSLEELAE